MTKTFGNKTAQEWLTLAEEYKKLHQEGLEQEASENFRSQAAWSDLYSRYKDFATYAAEGVIQKCVLFDLQGNLIPGRWVDTKYGQAYLTTTGTWLNPSNAMKDATKVKNNAKKGFYEGWAEFKVHYNYQDKEAYAVTSNTAELVNIIDNGN